MLRKATLDDAQEIFDCWCSDDEVTKWLTWPTHESVDVTKKIVARWLKEYDDEKTVRYVIAEKSTGRLIGCIDVVSFDCGTPEVGYCSGKAFWGKGYMTEACAAFLKELKRLGYKSAIIRARVDNIGSNKVIQNCGGEWFGTMWDYVEKIEDIVQVNRYEVDLTVLHATDIVDYWYAVFEKDVEKMRPYFADNATIRWHNTNEVFTVERFLEVNRDYPGLWSGEIERVESFDNKIIMAVKVFSKESNSSFHAVSFFEVAGDKITALDEYWGDDCAPPAWRSDKNH